MSIESNPDKDDPNNLSFSSSDNLSIFPNPHSNKSKNSSVLSCLNISNTTCSKESLGFLPAKNLLIHLTIYPARVLGMSAYLRVLLICCSIV